MPSEPEQVHVPQVLRLPRTGGLSHTGDLPHTGGLPQAPRRSRGLAGPHPYAPVAGALRAVETFLLSGGQQTARRNAWAAVEADRQRARDRREAERAMAALPGNEAGTLPR